MYAIDDRNRHTANKAEYAGYDMQRRPLQPQINYADDKGKNIRALRDEIEHVYTAGMSHLLDEG